MFLYSRNTWYRNVYTGIFVNVYSFLNRYKLDISVSSNILIFMFRHTYCVVALHMYVHLQLFGKALLHVHNVMLCILSTNLVVITVVTDLEVIDTFAMTVVMMTILHGKNSMVSLQLASNLFWWVILQHVIFCWYFVESQSLFNIICLIFGLCIVSISLIFWSLNCFYKPQVIKVLC